MNIVSILKEFFFVRTDDNILSMNKKHIKLLIKFVISVVIIVFIFRKVDFADLYAVTKMFNLKYFFWAVVIIPIRLIVKAFRWQIIMRKAVKSMSISESMKSMLVSTALGLLTPMRVGQAGVVTYIESDSNLKTGFLAFLDVVFDLVVIIFASAIAFLYVYMVQSQNLMIGTSMRFSGKVCGVNLLTFPGYIYLLLSISFFIVTLLSILFIAKPGPFFGFIGKLGKNKIVGMLSSLSNLKIYSKNEMIMINLYSVIIFLMNLVQFQFLTYSFEIVPIRIILIAYPLIILGVCFPITIAGIGAREGVAAWIFYSFGVNPAIGISSSFLLFFMNMVIPSIFGIIIYNLRSNKK
jgi:glycosyltransferase 2 family protein